MSVPPPPSRHRTTPRWAQVPALFLVLLLAGYFSYAFALTVTRAPVGRWVYPGSWSMFTWVGRSHAIMEAEVLREGEWEPLDLQTLFPSVWDSGPRYARGPFRASRSRLRILADSTCQRHPEPIEQVRLIKVAWPMTVGAWPQPRRKVGKRTLLEHRCGMEVQRPTGRRL